MTNVETARAYITAVQTGDQETLGKLLSPKIVWHQPGNNRFSGTHRGVAAIGDMLGKMMEVSQGTFAITDARRFMATDDLVAVEVEFSGERDGVELSQPGIDLLRIDDGKVVEVWLFSSDEEQEDSFWGS